jgi:hypothetical protein
VGIRDSVGSRSDERITSGRSGVCPHLLTG